VIAGDLLRSVITLIAEGVGCDLVVADPPWPGQFFRYSTAWEDDPNSIDSGTSAADLDQSERDWLRFMRPRLEAFRLLLRDTGVLVLTSEHRNLFRVGQLVDEIFGVRNRLTVLGWAKQYAYGGRVGTTYDYLIVVARDRARWLEGPGRTASLDPPQWWTAHEVGEVTLDASVPGYRTAGINELTRIIGPDHRFFAAKPSSLYKRIISGWCPRDGSVIDPFAGSGAAGHAVLDLNAEGADRRFILIDEAHDTLDGPAIARHVSAERVRRVISGEWSAGDHASRPGAFSFELLR
jgi:DNA modification methylase